MGTQPQTQLGLPERRDPANSPTTYMTKTHPIKKHSVRCCSALPTSIPSRTRLQRRLPLHRLQNQALHAQNLRACRHPPKAYQQAPAQDSGAMGDSNRRPAQRPAVPVGIRRLHIFKRCMRIRSSACATGACRYAKRPRLSTSPIWPGDQGAPPTRKYIAAKARAAALNSQPIVSQAPPRDLPPFIYILLTPLRGSDVMVELPGPILNRAALIAQRLLRDCTSRKDDRRTRTERSQNSSSPTSSPLERI